MYQLPSPSLPYNPYRKQLFVMATATWLVLVGLLIVVLPTFVENVIWYGSYLPFFLLLFLSLLWSIWGLTGRWKKSILWSFIVTTVVWLRVNQLDSPINFLLILGFGGVWEYYWHLVHIQQLEQQL